MAFNYQPSVKGYAGAPFMTGTGGLTPFLEFFRFYNDRYYTGTEEVNRRRGAAQLAFHGV